MGSVRGTPACGAGAIPRALCLRGPGVSDDRPACCVGLQDDHAHLDHRRKRARRARRRSLAGAGGACRKRRRSHVAVPRRRLAWGAATPARDGSPSRSGRIRGGGGSCGAARASWAAVADHRPVARRSAGASGNAAGGGGLAVSRPRNLPRRLEQGARARARSVVRLRRARHPDHRDAWGVRRRRGRSFLSGSREAPPLRRHGRGNPAQAGGGAGRRRGRVSPRAGRPTGGRVPGAAAASGLGRWRGVLRAAMARSDRRDVRPSPPAGKAAHRWGQRLPRKYPAGAAAGRSRASPPGGTGLERRRNDRVQAGPGDRAGDGDGGERPVLGLAAVGDRRRNRFSRTAGPLRGGGDRAADRGLPCGRPQSLVLG